MTNIETPFVLGLVDGGINSESYFSSTGGGSTFTENGEKTGGKSRDSRWFRKRDRRLSLIILWFSICVEKSGLDC